MERRIKSEGSEQIRLRGSTAITRNRQARRPAINVGDAERLVSGLLGGALLLTALPRKSAAGAMLALGGAALLHRGVSGHCPAYSAVGTSTAGQGPRLFARSSPLEIQRSITVGKSADELYRFWRNPRNLAQVLGHFSDVEQVSDTRARWSANTPLGRGLAWDVDLVEDRPGERIAWRAASAQLPHQGSVEFHPGPADRGTEVRLRFRFDVPETGLGKVASKFLESGSKVLGEKTLRRFKSLVETGEIPSLDHAPAGSHRILFNL